MTMRLSISSLTGTARTLVAVGTVRLVSMFVTTRAAGPRSVDDLGAAGSAVGAATRPPRRGPGTGRAWRRCTVRRPGPARGGLGAGAGCAAGGGTAVVGGRGGRWRRLRRRRSEGE